jgi:acyl-CoA thioester hydrolase
MSAETSEGQELRRSRLPVLQVVPSFEEALALPATLEVSVEGGFIDPMGHMGTPWYGFLFDRATWAFFEGAGVNAAYRARTHASMFAVEQHLRFLAELREGDPLQIRSRLLALSPRSAVLLHLMIDPVRRRLSASSETAGVHVDMQTRRPTPFPEEIRTALAARLGAGG